MIKFYILILSLVFSAVLTAQNESDFYTEKNHLGVEKNFVTDYNGSPNDTQDDSNDLQAAIDDLSSQPNGGKLIIPSGTYYLVNIEIKSNVHIEIDKDVTIFPTFVEDNKNYSVFLFDGNNTITRNISVRGLGGSYTVDFRNAENINGRVFLIGNVENFLIADAMVEDKLTKFSAVTGGVSQLGDEWNSAENGVVRNIEIKNGHYGYGVIQLQAGRNIFFHDLKGDGGVTLRFETGYNKMNELQVGGVFDMYGKNIYCQNGNAALMISPHATKNGHVEVDSVTSVNCGFAVRIGDGYTSKSQDTLGLSPGYFANTSKVSNVNATFGMTAQVKSKHFKYMPCPLRSHISEEKGPDGESYIAPSIAPILNGAAGTGEGRYTVTITYTSSEGFEYLDSDILYDSDAVEDCTTGIKNRKEESKASVYPNPFSSVLNINIKDWTAYNRFELYNLEGKIVYKESITQADINTTIDLPKGTYLLNIIGANNTISKTVIKK